MSAVTDNRELEHWLAELRRQRWTHVYLPDRDNPQVVTSIRRWQDGVDVIALFNPQDALAYRAAMDLRDDPFNPHLVTWVYAGLPVWTIRAALALPEPGHPGEPRVEQEPPPLVSALAELAGRHNRTVRPPRT